MDWAISGTTSRRGDMSGPTLHLLMRKSPRRCSCSRTSTTVWSTRGRNTLRHAGKF
jgi:hypothetical protein